jgi:hypothetical protein
LNGPSAGISPLPIIGLQAASPTTPRCSSSTIPAHIVRRKSRFIIVVQRPSLENTSTASNSRDCVPLPRGRLHVYAQYRSHHGPSKDSTSARHNADLKPYPTAPTLPHCPILYCHAAGMSLSRISRNAPVHMLYRYHRILHPSNRLSVSPPPTTAPRLVGPDRSAYNMPLYRYSSYPHFLSPPRAQSLNLLYAEGWPACRATGTCRSTRVDRARADRAPPMQVTSRGVGGA